MATSSLTGDKLVKTFNDTNYFAPGTYKRDFVQLFSSVTLANLIAKTLLAPLERWKIIKQTQTSYELRPQKMTSFANYFSRVRKEQGLKAFWRGNSANLWLHCWQALAQVALLDSIKSTCHEFAFEMQNEPIFQFLIERVAGPVLAAASTLVITHPIDTARVRVSMNYFRNPKEMLFTGITSCWSVLRLEEKGMRGLYRGYLLANLIAVLNLNIFVSMRDLWGQVDLGKDQILDVLASKETVGSLASLLLLHPLDTIKKNLQLNNQSKPMLFKNSRQVISYFQNGGSLFRKLYQGLAVTLCRHLLYCPTFILLSAQFSQHLQPF